MLTAIAIVFATLLGFVIGIARLSGNRLVAGVAAAYVEVVRNIPLLLQLFYWYFAVLRPLPGPRQSLNFFDIAFLNKRGLFLPYPVFEPGFGALRADHRRRWSLIGIALALDEPAPPACAPAPALHSVRAIALLLLVPPLARRMAHRLPALMGRARARRLQLRRRHDGASRNSSRWRSRSRSTAHPTSPRSCAPAFARCPTGRSMRRARSACGRGAISRFVVIPQALRVILPPLGTQYIVLLKNSSLAAAIAYPDLMLVFAGTVLNQTGQPLEVMIVTMASYALIGLVDRRRDQPAQPPRPAGGAVDGQARRIPEKLRRDAVQCRAVDC